MSSRLSRLLPPRGPRRSYLAVAGIDALGSGMFIPLSVLFLTRSVGLSAVSVGLGLTIAGVAGLVATPIAGALSDRLDPRALIAACYLACAVGFALYPLIDSFGTFVVLASVIQAFDRAGSSARTLVALSVVDGGERTALLAYERSTRNLGYGIGGLIAGAALLAHSRYGYDAVLLGNAASFAVGAMLVRRLPRGRPVSAPPGERGGYRTVLRDRRFVGLCLLISVIWLNDTILGVGVPLWLVRRTSLSPGLTGVFFTLNTVLVVLLQVRLSRSGRTIEGAARSFARSGLALGLGSVLFIAAAHGGRLGAGLGMVGAVVALTVGEMLVSAGQWGVTVELVPEHSRGRYLAFMSLMVSLERAAGPAIVTFVLSRGGGIGWVGFAAVFVGAGVAAAGVTRRAPRPAG